MKSGPEQSLVERYRERAVGVGKALGVTGFEIVEIPESRARRDIDRQQEEMDLLLQKAGDAHLILFDERFMSPSSLEFSKKLGDMRDTGLTRVACLLGGPDGVAPELRHRIHWGISFGRLSFPHQLARILVMEQLYRAMTLLAGHPYHRCGHDG